MNTHEMSDILAELEEAFMIQNGPRPTIHLFNEFEVIGEGQILNHQVKFSIEFKEK